MTTATRSLKGVLDSNNLSLLKNTISSPRGLTQPWPCISTVTTDYDEKASRLPFDQTRNLHFHTTANKTPAHLASRSHQQQQHQEEGRTRPSQTNNNNNKTKNYHHHSKKTNTTTFEGPSTGRPCTCPDCRMFPIHRGGITTTTTTVATVKDHDSTRYGARQFVDDIVRRAPFDVDLRRRLEGFGRFVEPRGCGSGSGVAVEEEVEERVDGDKMPRSGYDLTNMRRGGEKVRAAGVQERGEAVKEKGDGKGKGKGKGQGQGGKGGGGDGSGSGEQGNGGNNNGDVVGPAAPLERKERNIDDVRVPPLWL